MAGTNEVGWCEALGAELGKLERGTATRYDSGRRTGPAGWSPAPEARPSVDRRPVGKSAAAQQQSRLRGAHKIGKRPLPPLFAEDES